jgi:methylmalonyl-CoA/ethylmalonyl-CoA epimerase
MAQPERGAGAIGDIGQIALHVSDADRAERFYRDTVGLTELFRFGQLLFFDCGGVRLMLEGGHPSRPHGDTANCIYFKVSAIEGRVAQLMSRGAVFEREAHLVARMPEHELWMAFFRDPDNNLLALMEEKR